MVTLVTSSNKWSHISPLITCEVIICLLGKLLFTQPDVKKFELGSAAERAINKFGGLSRMTSLDSVLLAIMESDMAQVKYTQYVVIGTGYLGRYQNSGDM